MILLGLALAALIGISLGLLGGGGSVLTVPILVYILGFEAKTAIAMSLPIVGTTSLVGAASHWRAGRVQLRTALWFGVFAMGGSFLSARFLSPQVSGGFQLALLAIVMLAAAISMFRSARRPAGADAPRRPAALSMLVPVAFGVGILTGLVGIGGGFLIVPALVLLAGVPMKEAIGTSLVVIAMNTFAGYFGYAGHTPIPWVFLAEFTAVAIAGILGGAKLVKYVSQAQLKQGFAVFLLCIGAFILYLNRHALLPGDHPPATTAQ